LASVGRRTVVLSALALVVACGENRNPAPAAQTDSATLSQGRQPAAPHGESPTPSPTHPETSASTSVVASIASQGSPAGAVLVRVIDSLRAPESVAIGPDGRYYVSTWGAFGDGPDGAVMVIDPSSGKKSVYVSGLLDPCGIAFAGDTLWIADRNGVLRATGGGPAVMVAPISRFPRHTYFLNDIAIDRDGSVLVSDTGDEKKKVGGGVYRVHRSGHVTLVSGSESAVWDANGIVVGHDGSMWVAGYHTGGVAQRDAQGRWHHWAEGFGGPDGIALAGGRIFITDNKGGTLWMAADSTPGASSRRVLATGLKGPADLVVDSARARLLVPENGGNRLSLYKLPG
jgi:glucose/arabinose dehydrogenase